MLTDCCPKAPREPAPETSSPTPTLVPSGLTAGPPPWLELEGCSLLAWPVRTLFPPLPGLGDYCSHGAVYPQRSSRGKVLCQGGTQKCFSGPCIKQTPTGQAAEEAADMTIPLRQECAGQEARARQPATHKGPAVCREARRQRLTLGPHSVAPAATWSPLPAGCVGCSPAGVGGLRGWQIHHSRRVGGVQL